MVLQEASAWIRIVEPASDPTSYFERELDSTLAENLISYL
ncbi:unnamed protein product, partial [Rotaria sp. Silwood2]